MSFGKYAFIGTTRHYFDEEPEWFWDIKPIDAGMELDNSKFLAHRRLVLGPDGRTELPPTTMEVAFEEIALCFAGTNIPEDETKPVKDGGKPIITPDMSIDTIKNILRSFPRKMLMEIWNFIGEAYPYWGPSDPNVI